MSATAAAAEEYTFDFIFLLPYVHSANAVNIIVYKTSKQLGGSSIELECRRIVHTVTVRALGVH
jgi:hypothetical protein